MLMSTKSRLLEILELNKGETVSGEDLAARLQVSRTAVWKAVKSLREEGYQILAVTNKGYTLDEGNDILSGEAIGTWIHQPVEIEVWKEISSTNQRMKQAVLEKQMPHGSVVAADCQYSGKGRRGRTFYSPKGTGLYLSVLLYSQKTAQKSLEITAAAAVAVCRAVEKVCQVSLNIKWVNDLYLENKKVCGILTEAVTDFETGDIEFVVVGIGLNVYEPEKGFPEEIRDTAGAILSGNKKTDRNRLAGEIVNQLLLEAGQTGIPKEYISRNMVPERQIRISYGQEEREVLAKKILQDGRLLVINEKGEEEVLLCGDVSLKL